MLLLRWEKHVRETMGVSKQQTLVLLLDTGGGSLCHLSPEFTIACEAKRIRPVFFSTLLNQRRVRGSTPIVLPRWLGTNGEPTVNP